MTGSAGLPGTSYTEPFPFPEPLRRLVNAHGSRREVLQDPKRASGECGTETWEFIERAHRLLGIDIEEVFGDIALDTTEEPSMTGTPSRCTQESG